MSKHEELKAFVERFVNGYVAGSCNSYDQCLSVLKESVVEEGFNTCDQMIEQTLNAVLEEEEIFLCSECAWWCWSHEMSEMNDTTCVDCSPNGEYHYE